MSFTKLSLIIIAITLFITGCNTLGTSDTSYSEPYPNDIPNSEVASGSSDYWAKDNLDLQRVGNLLEQADDAEEFEYLLNSDEGINNLDLNGDGYVDYIGVSEFGDDYDNQRGFTLFDRFGPNEIQEIARIIFDRNSTDDPGARIMMFGNEQLYGDDYSYQTNWLDRSLAIASYVFGNRDTNYESPYYYNNYPDYYEPYRVVETPVYVSRIEQYYPEPYFVRVDQPIINDINVRSRYEDRSFDNIYARLVKPTREQVVFVKNNPNRPQFVEIKKNGKIKEVPAKFKEKFADKPGQRRVEFNNRGGSDRSYEVRNNPSKAERDIPRMNRPEKVERQKIEREIIRQQPPQQFERPNQKPNKMDNPGRGNGKEFRGNGGGNGNGNGKGNGGGNGGGNGKGNGGGGGNGNGGGGGKGKGKG